ncbi:MAG: protein kinase, partial [Anaerolineae bacterium]|nr:protein kinase [Anaerolineae bacterium]
MLDLTGHTFGQYRILELIGSGGMANVYRAVQTSIGREVAIKVLPMHFLQDPTFTERFNREVRVIALLEHPRILPVHDYGEAEGMPFIVMRLLPGGSLAERIKAAPAGMPLDETCHFVSQMAEGLTFAHQHGIIHRDFKPSNVLLDLEGNAYLADFGIARVAESTVQLTGSGIVGTPAYMAPEMAESGGVTHRVDIYALGVTLYQMLTGQHPFNADTPMGLLMAHLSKPVPDVLLARPDLPAGVQAVITQAMAKAPAERFAQAADLASALERACAIAPTSIGGPFTERIPVLGAIPRERTATTIDLRPKAAPPLPEMPSEGDAPFRVARDPEVTPPGTLTPASAARAKPSPELPPGQVPRRRIWPLLLWPGVVVFGLCGLVALGVALDFRGVQSVLWPPTPMEAVTTAPTMEPVGTLDPAASLATRAVLEAAWDASAHNDHTADSFTRWDAEGLIPAGCAKCHSHAGFADYLGLNDTPAGTVEYDAPVGSYLECSTCHNDATETLTQVAFPSGLVVNVSGGSAVCIACHQGRGSTPTLDEYLTVTVGDAPPDTVSDLLGFQNPHYAAAGAALYGTNAKGAYEYTGRAYAGTLVHDEAFDTCVECHDPHGLEINLVHCQECHDGDDPQLYR